MVDILPIDLFNGICAIATVLIYFIISFSLIHKYIKYRQKALIYMGLALFFLSSIWMGLSVSFIYYIIIETSISFEIQVLIAYGFPFALFFWLLVFTEIIYKKRQKIITIVSGIYLVLLEVFFYTFLFTNISLLGTTSGFFYTRWGPFILLRILVNVVIFLTTGIIFFREANKTDDAENKLKAKLILVGVIFLIIGSLFYSIFGIVFIALIILLMSVLGFYGGIVYPVWIAKIFLRNKK